MVYKKKEKVLVIVAHPDDETIWMGGLLIRNKKKWDTTVICMTRASDKDREPKFRKVMKALGVKCNIYDFDDTKHIPVSFKEYERVFKKYSRLNYNYIFTHGEDGEYGHMRHKEVHRVVKQALKQKLLKTERVLFFSYHRYKNNPKNHAIYNSNADMLIKLNRDEFTLKKNLITKVYGFQKDGFEEKSCGNKEAFLKLKNENLSSLSLSC